jgi:hypothetical protein
MSVYSVEENIFVLSKELSQTKKHQHLEHILFYLLSHFLAFTAYYKQIIKAGKYFK